MKLQKYYEDYDDMTEIIGWVDDNYIIDYLKYKYPSKPPESEPPLKKQKKDLVYIKNNIISNVDNV